MYKQMYKQMGLAAAQSGGRTLAHEQDQFVRFLSKVCQPMLVPLEDSSGWVQYTRFLGHACVEPLSFDTVINPKLIAGAHDELSTFGGT